MDRINYDIFMNALREVNPELANVFDFVKDQNSNKERIITFEDLAKMSRLD